MVLSQSLGTSVALVAVEFDSKDIFVLRYAWLSFFVLQIVSTFVLAAEPKSTWPGWRGEGRDGHTAGLPNRWSPGKLLWQSLLPGPGVGGIAATSDFVVVSGRDASDHDDLFVCLDPTTGVKLWEIQYPAPMELDYGNTPRATPMIEDPLVYVLGASGHLHCVDLDSGEVQWKRHLVDDFQGERPDWGYSGSPLLVADRLIVQPGGTSHSIVSLNAKDGELIWHGPGEQTGYAAPQRARWKGTDQIVAFDRISLGGWDVKNGKRLWNIKPEGPREFHVPTPLVMKDGLVTTGELRGTCRYQVDGSGRLLPTLVGEQLDVAPDTLSAIATNDWVVCVNDGLVAIDLKSMEIAWRIDDEAFSKHCSLIAANNRMLIVNESGEQLLVDIANPMESPIKNASSRILGRERIGSDSERSLSHPAIVGEVLYVRRSNSVVAWLLGSDEKRP